MELFAAMWSSSWWCRFPVLATWAACCSAAFASECRPMQALTSSWFFFGISLDCSSALRAALGVTAPVILVAGGTSGSLAPPRSCCLSRELLLLLPVACRIFGLDFVGVWGSLLRRRRSVNGAYLQAQNSRQVNRGGLPFIADLQQGNRFRRTSAAAAWSRCWDCRRRGAEEPLGELWSGLSRSNCNQRYLKYELYFRTH